MRGLKPKHKQLSNAPCPDVFYALELYSGDTPNRPCRRHDCFPHLRRKALGCQIPSIGSPSFSRPKRKPNCWKSPRRVNRIEELISSCLVAMSVVLRRARVASFACYARVPRSKKSGLSRFWGLEYNPYSNRKLVTFLLARPDPPSSYPKA